MSVENPQAAGARLNVRPVIAAALWLLLLLLITGAVSVRISLALRPGLWVDEIFSLAMASGHSLEHAPALADPALGDYIETPAPQLPAAWRHYTEHASPAAGSGRVIRAVLLSDTNPPLYYVLLNGWTRYWGTSDAALRLFSVFCALICLPLIWVLARRVDGRQTAWIALVLFAASPAAIYYAAEGRMYALTWFFALTLVWLTLRLHDEGARPSILLSWMLAAAGGMLTHYFLAFVGAACGLWLLLYPGRCRRDVLLATAGLVCVLLLPWYRQVPEALSAWRVTSGWLNKPLGLVEVFGRPLQRATEIVSGGSDFGTQPRSSSVLVALLCAVIAGWLLWGRDTSPLRPRIQLIWGWMAASVLGVVLFDLVLGTGAVRIARYMLPGLPAGLLLLAVCIARLPPLPRWAVVVLLMVAWSPAVRAMYVGPSRPVNAFPEIAAAIERGPAKPDLIIVDSIPSGVIGVSRYLHSEIPVASWVVRLGERQSPTAMTELVAKHCRITLVKVHRVFVGAGASPPEVWLRANAIMETQTQVPRYSNAQILNFRLKGIKDGAGSSCVEHS
jgi:hypothetical protein